MFQSSPWIGYHPVTQGLPNTTDDYFMYNNFEIYFGPGSKVSVPLFKKSHTTVLIKNLPREVTKEMIKELLISKPVEIQPSAIVSVEILGVVGGKASCKVEFDLDVNASLVNSIHTWYMKISNSQDETPISQIIIEYPEPMHPECNEASIQQLKEDLANDSTFKNALRTLEHWLTKGEVNKRNADSFIALLYSVYMKVNALNNEKMASDSKLHDSKKELKSKVESLSLSLKELKTVLKNASLKKVWDHFSKPQRKNLETWQDEVDKLEKEYSQELLSQREEDEMEICDGEKESTEVPDEETISSLKDQLDTLLSQKDTLEKELSEYKSRTDEELAQKQVVFCETLREVKEWQEKIEELKKDLANANVRTEETDNSSVTVSDSTSSETTSDPLLRLSDQDVYNLGLLTSFLNLHINGANIEYLTSFLKDSGQAMTPEDVEELMRRFPNIFSEETTGVGADIKKVWKYVWPAKENS